MNSILIAIQPKWCELIASGKKTIEVRKTAPKEVPFKVYMYCTNGAMLRDNLRCGVTSNQEDVKNGKLKRFVLSNEKSNNVICSSYPFVNRKIIGEFVCERVQPIAQIFADTYCENACLSIHEMLDYGTNWDIIRNKIKRLFHRRTTND